MNSLRFLSLLLLVSSLIFSCANQVTPTGGNKDIQPPEILKFSPKNETTNFNSRKILIYFDEFLKPGNPQNAIIISPEIPGKTKMWFINKKILIKLPKKLPDSTTFVLTLTPEIRDYTEGNPLSKSYYYAFSTYNKLDTAKLAGKIFDPTTGKPEKNFAVFLFLRDSIVNLDFAYKKPLYISFSDASGFFEFKYLKPGKYYVLAVADKDKSKSLSPGEKLALTENPLIEISEKVTDTLVFFSGFIDTTAPKITSVRPVPKTYRYEIKLSEPAEISHSPTSLLRFPRKITASFFLEKIRNSDTLVHLSFTDTLNNASDSTLILPELMPPDSTARISFAVAFSDTNPNIFFLKYTFPPDSAELPQKISILDTSGNSYPFSFLKIRPQFAEIAFAPANREKEFFIRIDSSLQSLQKIPVDSTLQIPLKLPSPENYGTLELLIPETPDYRYFLTGKKLKIPLPSGKNSLLLREGDYTLFYFEDKNQNARRDELSLRPYRLPERIFLAEKIKLRGGWNVKIKAKPPEDLP